MGRLSVVCLSSVTLLRPTHKVERFGNSFAQSGAQGLGQFVLLFYYCSTILMVK